MCNTMIFNTAFKAWQSCDELRVRRNRYKSYTYGRQWDDIIVDRETGKRLREGTVAERSGRKPLTNNLIRQLVKTVVGRYRRLRDEKDEERTAFLSHLYEVNRLGELDCRLLEEFLISGCAIQKISRECRKEGLIETYVDNVSPNDFFINAVRDPRGWDIQLVGMLHDMSLPEVIMKYAHGDRDKAAEIRKIYGECFKSFSMENDLGGARNESDRPFYLSQTGRCRVIEVWTLESCEVLRCHDTKTGIYYECHSSLTDDLDKENELRDKNGEEKIEYQWNLKTLWRCRIFAPNGKEIDSFVSPYSHGEHPFVVKLYPLIDGEIHSFVEDVIPQQRHINRLITLIDNIMSTSSKGALLFPVESKVDGLRWEDYISRWASCGALIPYHSRPGIEAPHQVTSSGLDAGASKLLEIQLQMLQDVSGVNNTLYGGNISGNVGADRYEKQVQNATVALADILETFMDLLKMRDAKAEKSL